MESRVLLIDCFLKATCFLEADTRLGAIRCCHDNSGCTVLCHREACLGGRSKTSNLALLNTPFKQWWTDQLSWRMNNWPPGKHRAVVVYPAMVTSYLGIRRLENKAFVTPRRSGNRDHHSNITCWRHQMVAFSALLTICAGNSPVTGEFPAQRPVTQSFNVFFDLRLNKWLTKQWRRWWFETTSR